MPSFTVEQVAAHNKDGDVWIVVHDKVYDLSKFLDKHPGGKKVLLKVAGQNASKQFDQFHSPAILQQWHDKLYVGDLAGANAAKEEEKPVLEGLKQGETFGELVPFGTFN